MVGRDGLVVPASGVFVHARPYADALGHARTVQGSADALGDFALAVEGPGDFEVDASGPGLGSTPVLVTLDTRGEHPPLVLEARRLGSIRGRVVDRDGRPAAGARVEARPEVDDGGKAGASHTSTDASGQFDLGVTDGLYRVRASSPERVAVVRGVAPDGAPLELRLTESRASGSVRGAFVGPDGAPLPGALVTFEHDANDAPPLEARVGADGVLALGDLDTGMWTVAFVEPPRASGPPQVRAWVREVEVRAGAEVDLGFDAREARGSIVGRALRGGGPSGSEPVHILVTPAEPSREAFGLRVAVEADPSGAFAVGDVPAGRYSVLVDGGTIGGRALVSVEAGREAFVEVLLEIR